MKSLYQSVRFRVLNSGFQTYYGPSISEAYQPLARYDHTLNNEEVRLRQTNTTVSLALYITIDALIFHLLLNHYGTTSSLPYTLLTDFEPLNRLIRLKMWPQHRGPRRVKLRPLARLDAEEEIPPLRPGGPVRPPNKVIVRLQPVEQVVRRLETHLVAAAAELGQEGRVVVLLEPGCRERDVLHAEAGAHARVVRPAEVGVEVQVHVEGEVVGWVLDRGEDVGVGRYARGGDVGPVLGAGVAISGRKDELLRAGRSDAVDGGLVVREDELRGHVVRLVHDAEDEVGVVAEGRGQLGPERLELRRRGGVGVGGVADDAAGVGLG